MGSLVAKSKLRIKTPMKPQVRECDLMPEPTGNSPERALGVAVLQRAVLDLITPGVDVRYKADALAWIQADDFEYCLSFGRIVESITDMNLSEVRSQLLNFVDKAQISKGEANGFRFQRGYKQLSLPPLRMGQSDEDC